MTLRRGTLATTLRAARVTVHMLQGVATTLVVFPLAGDHRRRTLIRRWSDKLLRLLRIEARVAGSLDVEPGNLLVVANHVSWLDIFVLNAQHPLRFVAKAELARWPLAGRLIREAGTIFVTRERRHDTKRVNRHATEALSRGDVVAVFPEGTTTDGTTLLRFHASLLQPIVDSQGRVQPVALRYLDVDDDPTTAAVYGDETFIASFWRICGEPGLRVDVVVADPIAARDRHRRELAHEAERIIRRALRIPGDATAPGTSAARATTSR
jgi:1-acyl-sn-glycerol-3-phosphate acyltransferase